MANLMRISEAASLALHTVSFLAATGEAMATTGEIARAFGVSHAHLSKVLQRLVGAGIVNSARGPHGGFRLAPGGRRATLLDVYQAIEGPIQSDECLLGSFVCGGKCIMGDLITSVNRLVTQRLSKTKVSDVARLPGRRRNR